MNMERYRSGHNGAVLKTVCLHGRMGSNPIHSAKRKKGRPETGLPLSFSGGGQQTAADSLFLSFSLLEIYALIICNSIPYNETRILFGAKNFAKVLFFWQLTKLFGDKFIKLKVNYKVLLLPHRLP